MGREGSAPRQLWAVCGEQEQQWQGWRCLTVLFCPAPDYFSAYLGEYRNVLSALETLNAAVLAAMDKTKLVRTAPGEGCRGDGCEIGAVLSSAPSWCEIWGWEAANPSNQGVSVRAWLVCMGGQCRSPAAWRMGKGKSKAFVLWRHHLQGSGSAVPAAPCPGTLWEHH